jgi:hypothetical protein
MSDTNHTEKDEQKFPKAQLIPEIIEKPTFQRSQNHQSQKPIRQIVDLRKSGIDVGEPKDDQK